MPEVRVDQVGPTTHSHFWGKFGFPKYFTDVKAPESAFAPVKWVTRIWRADRTTEAWLTSSGYASGEHKGAPRTPLRLPRFQFYKNRSLPPLFTLSHPFSPTPFPSPPLLLLSSSPPDPPWLRLGLLILKS